MGEVWKQISNYEGLYEVSSLGRVRSLPRHVRHSKNGSLIVRRGKMLKPTNDTKGYPTVCLSKNGVVKRFRVHRLVCRAFNGRPPAHWEVCHRDGNRENNKAKNLRWGTRASNHNDKRAHGTMSQGESHGRSKLTETQIQRIREDVRTQREIALDYGISQGHVSDIKRCKYWRTVC